MTSEATGAPWPRKTESYSIVDGGFKLIHHRTREEGTPEFELFDVMKGRSPRPPIRRRWKA